VVSPIRETGDYVSVGSYPFQLRRAAREDLSGIHHLLNEAVAWLRGKGTDQWERPWPSREGRDRRILAALERGETWIVWDGAIPVATITITTRADPEVWSNLDPQCDLSARAVYAQRLITARRYAGRELGSELIDWAGLLGERRYGAQWIRVDVWRSNRALHDYYKNSGFSTCGTCADPRYPSGALFQKPVRAIRKPRFPKFTETFPAPGPPPAASSWTISGQLTVLCGERP
jgi:ribosomal protein S18 acetylase RimI-like enzyme